MLLQLSVDNFRGHAFTFDLHKRTLLSGRNGAGKSTVKEAIAFLFTGQDSSGNRAPVHLITDGAPGCRVEVKTSRATICRSLSRKKNSTLTLTRAGVSTTLTQTQFEGMLCSADHFLSVFNCGYFMKLEGNRQKAVLAEILPKIDRYALWEELSGVRLTPEERLKFDLSKRIDLVEGKVGEARRELQRQVDLNCGQLATYANVTKDLVEPTPSPAVTEAKRLESLRLAWTDYRARLAVYNSAVMNREHTEKVNGQIAERRAQLEKELAEFNYLTEKEPPTALYEEWQRLHQSFKAAPPPPAMMKEVESENCPTCGQTVGLKHREKVRAANARAQEEYQRVCNEVQAYNLGVKKALEEVEAQRSEAMKEVNTIKEANQKLKVREAQLRAELEACRPHPLPPLPEKPVPPEEVYDEESARRSIEEARAYERKRGEYEFAKRQRDEAKHRTAGLEQHNASLGEAIGRFRRLEETLKALPEEEFKRQTAALSVEGYHIELADRVILRDHRGCPYELLSTGEQVKASLALALKFNSLHPRPVGVVFVDNADLVDSFEFLREGVVQFFFAHVAAGEELTVKEWGT